MRRLTWLLSIVAVVVGSIAADRPVPSGKKPASRAEPKDQAKAKATGRSPAPAVVQDRPQSNDTPDPRATSLFRSARNLEAAGKKTGAIGLYRDVLIRYPRSPEAPGSAARIKVLGGKVPAASEIKPAPPAKEAKFTRHPRPRYASQKANRDALNQVLDGMIGNAMSQSAPNGSTGSYGNGGAYSP